MRLTIIPSDNTVIMDGEPRKVDCSGFGSLEGLSAVQWDDDIGGHVEFDNRKAIPTTFKINEAITSIEPYQDIIDAWVAAAPPPPPPPPVVAPPTNGV